MNSVRFQPGPSPVYEVPSDKASSAARGRSPTAEKWQSKWRQALPNVFPRPGKETKATTSAVSLSAPPSPRTASPEPFGRSLASPHRVQSPPPGLLPPPAPSPAQPITRWEKEGLRFGVLSQLLTHYKIGLGPKARRLVDLLFAPDVECAPGPHAMALRWTGLLETPSSLGRDGTLFLMFRAARLVAQETPSWCTGTHLAHGRELLCKFTAALHLVAGRQERCTQAEREEFLERAERTMRQSMAAKSEYSTPRSAGSCVSRSMANEFAFAMFTLDVKSLPRAGRVLLQEAGQDVESLQITDFLLSLQYHRTAAMAWHIGQERAWAELRPIVRELCQYEQRLHGDEEAQSCVPSAMLSLLHIEKFLLQYVIKHEKTNYIELLREQMALIRPLLPEPYPFPLFVELSQTLIADASAVRLQRMREGYRQYAENLKEPRNEFMHFAQRAREQSTRLLLHGVVHALRVESETYEPFSKFKTDDTLRTLFRRLEQAVIDKGYAERLPMIDALAHMDAWTPDATLEAIKALSEADRLPSESEFAQCCMAVLDAAAGEHAILAAPEEEFAEDLSASTDPNKTLRSLYAAASLEVLMSVPGLGLSEKHGANVTLLRAFFAPRGTTSFTLSERDLSRRLAQARAFGRKLAANPDGKEYAYLALGAALTSEGTHPKIFSFLLEVIGDADGKARRLLYHLVKEDTRWCRPRRQEKLRLRLKQGYAYQKSKAPRADREAMGASTVPNTEAAGPPASR